MKTPSLQTAAAPAGLLVPALALAAAFLGSVWAQETLSLPAAGRVGVAAVPVAAFGWFIVREIRLLRATDEMYRRIQLEALAIAYPSALLLIFLVGALERGGIFLPGFERLRDAWPLLVLPYFAGLWWTWRRYA